MPLREQMIVEVMDSSAPMLALPRRLWKRNGQRLLGLHVADPLQVSHLQVNIDKLAPILQQLLSSPACVSSCFSVRGGYQGAVTNGGVSRLQVRRYAMGAPALYLVGWSCQALALRYDPGHTLCAVFNMNGKISVRAINRGLV